MEQKISESLFAGVRTIVNNALNNFPADKTYFGSVRAVNSNGTYTVLINGKSFENTKSLGTCSLYERVYVLFPQGKAENRIILK